MLISLQRCFQLSFNPMMDRSLVLTALDSIPDVLNWYAVLPGQVFVVSARSASQRAHAFRQKFPNEFFTVAEIANIDGAMPKDVWEFLNDPKPSAARSTVPQQPNPFRALPWLKHTTKK